MSGDDDVLDLDSMIPTTSVVQIDGKRYDLTQAEDLGLRGQTEATRLWRRIQALEDQAEISDEDEAEYRDRLEAVVALALPACAPDVRARMTLVQLQEVATAFFARVQLAAFERLGRALNGATSSPGSSASTAGALPTG